MHTFVDNAGRTWTVAINATVIKRIKGLLGINIYKLLEDSAKPLAELVSDPIQLCDVLYVICKDEAEAQNVSDENFGRGLGGDSLALAADAFVEELIDFFPYARVRTTLRKVTDAGKKIRLKLIEHAETILDGLDIETEVEKLKTSSTRRQES
jgi:hypothetical protein